MPPPKRTEPEKISTPDVAVHPRPGNLAAFDHSFLLQIVSDLQRSLGRIEERMEVRASDLDKIDKRMERGQEKADEKFEKLSAQIADAQTEIKSAKAVASALRWVLPLSVAIITGVAVPVVLRLIEARPK